jgi:hypothetical protein
MRIHFITTGALGSRFFSPVRRKSGLTGFGFFVVP